MISPYPAVIYQVGKLEICGYTKDWQIIEDLSEVPSHYTLFKRKEDGTAEEVMNFDKEDEAIRYTLELHRGEVK